MSTVSAMAKNRMFPAMSRVNVEPGAIFQENKDVLGYVGAGMSPSFTRTMNRFPVAWVFVSATVH